jgi:hypothetical protein
MLKILLIVQIFWLGIVSTSVASAANTIRMQLSCTDDNGAPLNNCVQDIDALNQWIVAQAPSASNPARIDIGPGEFIGTLECASRGGIAIFGSGRYTTTISSNMAFLEPGIKLSNCMGVTVSHLTVKGGYRAVHLEGTSVSTWNDVEVFGGARGVYSTFGCNPQTTSHTWHNARIVAIPRGMTVAYDARCGKHSFFGSELFANGASAQYNSLPNNVVALKADQQTNSVSVLAVGSVIRAQLSTTNAGAVPMAAIQADHTAMISVAGSQIETVSSVAHDGWALSANSGAIVKVDGSSYVMSTLEPAVITRINTNGGTVLAPYYVP